MATGNDQFGNFSAEPPRAKSGAGKIVLIIFAILGGLGLLCCGGAALFMNFGMKAAGDQLVAPIKSNPELVAEVGPYKKAAINFMATAKEAEKNPQQGGEPMLVIDYTGEKGSVQILLQAKGEEVEKAIMRTKDGKEVVLINGSVDFNMPGDGDDSEEQ